MASDEMIVASTLRASRAARSPGPSEPAHGFRVARVRAHGRRASRARGLSRALKQAVVTYKKPIAPGRAGFRDVRKSSDVLDASTPSRPTAALSHVFSPAAARSTPARARRLS